MSLRCRWYVADGVLDRWSDANSSGQQSQPESSGRVERVILFRGVVWRSSEVDALRLWQNLMRFWPSAFAENLTNPPGALLAHAGGALSQIFKFRYQNANHIMSLPPLCTFRQGA